MRSRELYIDDELVDLPEDAPIEITFQSNNIGELKDRQSSFSATIILPDTARNRKALGFPGDIPSLSIKPYRKYDARYVEEGVENIANGIGVLNESSAAGHQMRLYFGYAVLFELIKDLKLSDLPSTTWDHTWHYVNQAMLAGTTSNVLYAIADYGGIYKLAGFNDIDAMHLHPTVYLHSLVRAIVETQGFTVKGSLLDNERFKHQVVACTGTGIADSYLGANATLGVDLDTNVQTALVMTAELNDPTEALPFHDPIGNIGSEVFPVVITGNIHTTDSFWRFKTYVQGKYKIALKLHLVGTDYNSQVQITVFKRPGGMPAAEIFKLDEFSPGAAYDIVHTLEFEFDAMPNERYWFNVASQATDCIVKADSTFEAVGSSGKITYGKWFQVARNLPDIKQSDLLKSVLQEFGAIADVKAWKGTVAFRQMNLLADNLPSAKNWTAKINRRDLPRVQFHDHGYAQKNWLRWDNDKLLGTLGLSTVSLGDLSEVMYDGVILVDDTTLTLEKEEFKLVFSASDTTPSLVLGGIGAIVPKYDFTGTTGYWSEAQTYAVDEVAVYKGRKYKAMTSAASGTPPDKEIDSGLFAYGTFWEDLGSVEKDIKPRTFIAALKPSDGHKMQPPVDTPAVVVGNVAETYFAYPERPYSLDMPTLIDEEMHVLRDTLYKYKAVHHEVALSQLDVDDFDHLVPVYDEVYAAAYYVNKIAPYAANFPSKVELIKIG